MQISEHISFDEATISQTGERMKIDNTPTNEILANMQIVAAKCFEPIRSHFGIPLKVSSFYRCPALNAAIGGVPNSQHQYGEAIDIEAGRDMNVEIFEWAKENLKFDQLLNEFPDAQGRPAWVHISYVSEEKNRQQAINITK